ncbi:Succinate-semialdehyde dehydrogenase [Pseudomonas savastanoi pv. glycinea]|nr:Succinate-semialdehyde dehydrogenase [Pseudomonas savastanoi pv. glycinea]
MVAKFRAGGQSCVAANRFFIHSSIYDAFLTQLVGRVEALTVGHGLSGADVGPVINESAALRINELIDDAVRAGAVLMCGGYESGTAFIHPAIVCDVSPRMRIYNEEVFGPVASVCSFTDVASLVTELNSEDTGLIAYLIGKHTSQLMVIADDLDVGMVGINTGLVSDASMPFGGMKCSGLGREGSKEGIEAFLETKYIKSAG